jgi:hypothetical protein
MGIDTRSDDLRTAAGVMIVHNRERRRIAGLSGSALCQPGTWRPSILEGVQAPHVLCRSSGGRASCVRVFVASSISSGAEVA